MKKKPEHDSEPASNVELLECSKHDSATVVAMI